MVDTNAYLALGLTIVAGVLSSYVLSLALRFRQTQYFITLLENLAQDEK